MLRSVTDVLAKVEHKAMDRQYIDSAMCGELVYYSQKIGCKDGHVEVKE